MGFSTLDGLIMATRIGALDPGVILHLMRTENYGLKELEDLLYNKSGLLGLSGLSPDMRTLLASPEPAARDADRRNTATASAANSVRLQRRSAGSMPWSSPAASARTRRRCAPPSAAMPAGSASNSMPPPTIPAARLITTKTSRTAAWVVPTDEELIIAAHTRAPAGAVT